MAKIDFKPGNMLYPLPAVLVTVADKQGKSNIFTVAWAGTVCTNPPMVSISVRKERFSHAMLLETGELGSHDMVLAEVVAVSVDDAYMDEKNSFHLDQADPIVYSHGTYYAMGKELGRFGYSVRKKS